MTMNPDGSEKKKVSGISGFEIFSISPGEIKSILQKGSNLIRPQTKNTIFPGQKSELLMI